MTNLPKDQFVIVYIHKGRPFSVTIDNYGGKLGMYDTCRDEWVEISSEEISYYISKALKIITSDDLFHM